MGWGGGEGSRRVLCPKYNLNFYIKTEPVTRLKQLPRCLKPDMQRCIRDRSDSHGFYATFRLFSGHLEVP